jgi:hypothetical protein
MVRFQIRNLGAAALVAPENGRTSNAVCLIQQNWNMSGRTESNRSESIEQMRFALAQVR